jgi:hypothetical protein
MAYRNIDAGLVLETLTKLETRIHQRFPNAGLEKVCAELASLAQDTAAQVLILKKPLMPLRLAIGFVLLLGFGAALVSAQAISLKNDETEFFALVSGLEAAVNLVLLMGAGIFVLSTIETRLKRHRAMNALHELRSIIHVIDMHQLTKDPVMIGGARTSASPEHSLSAFELVRYLDYCSEMLSLAGKLAALYAQDFNDSAVIEAASDIEQLATNLSQKVWQKITIVQVSAVPGQHM